MLDLNLRCLIVDDNSEFLEAARLLLAREGLTVVGVASSARQARAEAGRLQPDVTLVDVNLGQEDGFAVARDLAGPEGSGGIVILISTHDEGEFAELIEASPAVGFLAKPALSASEIIRLVGLADAGWRQR